MTAKLRHVAMHTSDVRATADFYKKGYLGGKDYATLNFDQSVQLLSQGKSPFMLGHSQAVATLARDAAACLDLPAAERTRLYRAGLTAGFS